MNLSDLRNPYVLRPRFVAANYTAKPGDLCHVDSGTSPLTITLPASPNVDTYVGVWDANNNANANNITIARNGQTIQGLTDDWVINVDSGRVDLVFDGTTWQVAFVTVGGLNQTQVDARVVAVASGKQRRWLRPGTELLTTGSPSVSSSTLIDGVYRRAATISFNNSSDGNCFWVEPLPPRWNVTGLRFRFFWQPSNTNTDNVKWRALCLPSTADEEAFSTTVGENSYVLDAGSGVADDLQISPWTGIITPVGIANNTLLSIIFQRQAGSGVEDEYTGNARLIGIEAEWTSNTPTDD